MSAGLSYISKLLSLVFISSFSSSFSFSLQHLQQQQQRVLQKVMLVVTTLSQGLRECSGLGRKSQLRRNDGRKRGQRFCIMFTTITKIAKTTTGTPTPTKTCHPAMERPRTDSGKRRKIRMRYSAANQRYLAVRLPRALANRMGMRVKGMGYQSRIPLMLKKK